METQQDEESDASQRWAGPGVGKFLLVIFLSPRSTPSDTTPDSLINSLTQMVYVDNLF